MMLRRPRRAAVSISLVPMIDVLMILLVFFMVTSTYLDLDMIPAADSTDDPAAAESGADTAPATTLLIRLGADGQPYIRGQRLTLPELAATIRTRLAQNAATPVLLLPSARAPVQALVSVMDTATAAGAARLRVIRLEAAP